MANIADKVQQIRNARYGRDVRESFASSIEAMNEESEDAKASAAQSAADADSSAKEAAAAKAAADKSAADADAKAQMAREAAEAATAAATEAQTATGAANTAAREADTSRDAANEAAQNAREKALAAQEAALAADSAAAKADGAAGEANTAAEAASGAARNAGTQAEYARGQGDRADALLGKIEETDVGGMAADILELQAGKADIAALGAKADLVGGKVPASQLPEMEYDPAGSAEAARSAVQTNLNSHTGNKSNPHEVTASQVGAAAASHTHSDKLSLSGGTMTGQLKAQTNTAYGTAQVRNIIVSTTDLEAGVSPLENGTLYLVYEE